MSNSTELEKRLRERLVEALGLATEPWHDDPAFEYGWGDVLTAARIGAEIEREECAQLADVEASRSEFATQARTISTAIRARGGK